MSSEIYSISVDTANGVVQQPLLIDEILDSSIVTLLIGIKINGNTLTITFISAISGPEKTTLDGVVATHQGPPVNETVEEVVNTDSIQSIGLGGVDVDLLNINGNILSPVGPTGGIEGMIINADINTVINIDNNEIKASAAIDTTKLANGTVSNAEFQRLDGILSSVVGISDSQTLTNKTINADNNTITNIDNNEIKAGAAIDTTKLANGTVSNAEFQRLDGILSSVVGITDTQVLTNKTLTSPIISTISNTGTLTLPTSTDTLVGRATTDTLTNKTINADNNTITNIDNNEIKAGAAIDADKIANGTVSNAEFQFINSVTSNVQDQLNDRRRFDAYNTASQILSTTAVWTPINLNVQRTIDLTHFTHTVGTANVTINTTGSYLVIGRFTSDLTSGGRSNIQARFAVNGVGVPGTIGVTYNRNAPQGQNTCTLNMIISLTSTNTIRIEGQLLSGNGVPVTVTGGCSLTILRV